MASRPHAVILAGGSPSQQLSAGGNWLAGLEGIDSHFFGDFHRALGELRSACARASLPLEVLFESVVPGNVDNIAIITDGSGLDHPILLDAAYCAWMHRRRLDWSTRGAPDGIRQLLS